MLNGEGYGERDGGVITLISYVNRKEETGHENKAILEITPHG